MLSAQLLLHSIGLVHGDIKLANWVVHPYKGYSGPVSAHDQPKWIDFGGAIQGYDAPYRKAREWDTKGKIVPSLYTRRAQQSEDLCGTQTTANSSFESLVGRQSKWYDVYTGDQFSLGISIANFVMAAPVLRSHSTGGNLHDQARTFGAPRNSLLRTLLLALEPQASTDRRTGNDASEAEAARLEMKSMVDDGPDAGLYHALLHPSCFCQKCITLHRDQLVKRYGITNPELEEMLADRSDHVSVPKPRNDDASRDSSAMSTDEKQRPQKTPSLSFSQCIRCVWSSKDGEGLKKSRVWDVALLAAMNVILNRSKCRTAITARSSPPLVKRDASSVLPLARYQRILTQNKWPQVGMNEASLLGSLDNRTLVALQMKNTNGNKMFGPTNAETVVAVCRRNNLSFADLCVLVCSLTLRQASIGTIASLLPNPRTLRFSNESHDASRAIWKRLCEAVQSWRTTLQSIALASKANTNTAMINSLRSQPISLQASVHAQAISQLVRALTHHDPERRADIWECIDSPFIHHVKALFDPESQIDITKPQNEACTGDFRLMGDKLWMLDESRAQSVWSSLCCNALLTNGEMLNDNLTREEASPDKLRLQANSRIVANALVRDFWMRDLDDALEGNIEMFYLPCFTIDRANSGLQLFSALTCKYETFMDETGALSLPHIGAPAGDLLRWELAHVFNACQKLCNAAYLSVRTAPSISAPDDCITYWLSASNGGHCFVSQVLLDTLPSEHVFNTLALDKFEDYDDDDDESDFGSSHTSSGSGTSGSSDDDMSCDDDDDDDGASSYSDSDASVDSIEDDMPQFDANGDVIIELRRKHKDEMSCDDGVTQAAKARKDGRGHADQETGAPRYLMAETNQYQPVVVTASAVMVDRWFEWSVMERCSLAIPQDTIRTWIMRSPHMVTWIASLSSYDAMLFYAIINGCVMRRMHLQHTGGSIVIAAAAYIQGARDNVSSEVCEPDAGVTHWMRHVDLPGNVAAHYSLGAEAASLDHRLRHLCSNFGFIRATLQKRVDAHGAYRARSRRETDLFRSAILNLLCGEDVDLEKRANIDKVDRNLGLSEAVTSAKGSFGKLAEEGDGEEDE